MTVIADLRETWILGGFNSFNNLGLFNGPNLEAVLETPSEDTTDRVFVDLLRPMTDAKACFGALAVLSTTMGTLVYTKEQPLNKFGTIPQRIDTRYARARIRIPAGQRWTYCMGVRPTVVPAQGDR